MIIRIDEEIKGGETDKLEFKASTRRRNGEQNPDLEDSIVKCICGFLNKNGGKVLIGVDDKSNVVGLEKDYNSLGKRKNRDGFRLHLGNIINSRIGLEYFGLLKTRFHEIDGKDICEIEIEKSPEPMLMTEKKEKKFYVRNGTSTNSLIRSEAKNYIKRHFKIQTYE